MVKPTRIPMINGVGPMPPRQQAGMEKAIQPRVSPETLRRMDHPEWLEGFARSLQLRTTVEMTPYRMGVLNRVLLCAEYIRLLRHDIVKLTKELDETTRDLERAVAALDHHLKLDREMGQPHHGHHDPAPDDEPEGR